MPERYFKREQRFELTYDISVFNVYGYKGVNPPVTESIIYPFTVTSEAIRG